MSENKINIVLKNTMTSMPYTIYQAALLAYLISGDYMYGLFFLSAIIFGDGANALEKQIFKFFSKGSKFGKRPSGCGIRKSTKSCTGCGIFPELEKKSKTWGMPSGHAQILSLTATFWSLYIIGKYQKNKKNQNLGRLVTQLSVLWVIVIIICAQRVYSKCHSILQVIIGSLFGISFGILSYFICRKVNSKKFPKSLFIK